MAKFRNFTRRLFIISNIVAVVLFLLACANTFLHPGRWWFVALLGLIFPFLLAAVLIFFLVALFIPSCRRWAFVSLVALLLGWTNIHSLLAFHPRSEFKPEKPPHSLRILTWNVRSFDEFITKKRGASGHRLKMMNFIDQQQPDVICLQEFFEWKNEPKILPPNISYIVEHLHYPYYFFSRDYLRYNGRYEAGVILFSKYPIVDTAIMHYDRTGWMKASESLISADINTGTDTIRVYTTHLQSVLFARKDFEDIQNLKSGEGSIHASRSIVKKLRYAFSQREEQAQDVRAQLDKSPYPAFITGDFNDVPNSYSYSTIRGEWQDCWIKKGFGIGRTYVHISPTLRIDYILADPRLEVLQCRKFPLPWSDHNPVMADLRLPGAAGR